MFEVIIPIKAVSVNSAYAGKARRYLTERARDYKNTIAWTLKTAINSPDSSSYFLVELEFGFNDKRHRDVDDYLKLTIDACTGVVWGDDSQVLEVRAKKMILADQDFVKIRFTKINS